MGVTAASTASSSSASGDAWNCGGNSPLSRRRRRRGVRFGLGLTKGESSLAWEYLLWRRGVVSSSSGRLPRGGGADALTARGAGCRLARGRGGGGARAPRRRMSWGTAAIIVSRAADDSRSVTSSRFRAAFCRCAERSSACSDATWSWRERMKPFLVMFSVMISRFWRACLRRTGVSCYRQPLPSQHIDITPRHNRTPHRQIGGAQLTCIELCERVILLEGAEARGASGAACCHCGDCSVKEVNRARTWVLCFGSCAPCANCSR